jgi:acetylornithine deacetylase/succinyl-diaminopimelate desuccinylase-like protein
MKTVSWTPEIADRSLNRATRLLRQLVEQPSVRGKPDATVQCLEMVADDLSELGFSARWYRYGDVSNVVLERRVDEAPLVFAGHVDVVPAVGEWHSPPFELRRTANQLIGRGVCDMKGGIAAFAAGLHLAAELGLQLPPLAVVLTGDEETGSEHGMIPLLRELDLHPAAAICGEPTRLDVYLGNRGLVWLEIHLHGHGGHAGFAHGLDNPIPWAARVITALQQLEPAVRDDRFSPPSGSIVVTRVDAGVAEGTLNVVPDEVVVGIDRRLVPGEDPDGAINEVEAAVKAVVPPSVSWRLRVLRHWPPYVTDAETPIACLALEAVRATGRRCSFGTDPAADDSSWLGAAGIPTVLLGPGEPEQAHSTNERLDLSSLSDAVHAYTEVLARFGEHGPRPGDSFRVAVEGE